MLSSRWPRSPSHGKCSKRFCGSSRSYGRSHHRRQHETFDVMRSRATDGMSASECQGKWPDQTLDQAFGLPEVLVAVSTSRLSCQSAGKTRTLMPVWVSSGESRIKCHPPMLGEGTACLWGGESDKPHVWLFGSATRSCPVMSQRACSVFGSLILAILIAAPAAHAVCKSPKNICKHIDDCLQRTSDNTDAQRIREGVRARNGNMVGAGAEACARDLGRKKEWDD